MSAGAPWSVKGIDPKAREVAKDLARRSGMTLGEWLNRVILEDDVPEEVTSESHFTDRPQRPFAETPRFKLAATPGSQDLARIAYALDRLTDRIESSETRTGLAISGVEHSVRHALARIETAEREHVAVAQRLDGTVEEVAGEHGRLADRLRQVETSAAGPRSVEALRALEQSVTRLATRGDVALGADGAVLVDEVLRRLGDRLAAAEGRTSDALDSLRGALTTLDGRLSTVEAGAPGAIDQRLEDLAATLTRRVEDARAEVAEKLKASAAGQVESRLQQMAEHVRAAEQRSARAIERMGREVLSMAETLNRRVQTSEQRSAAAIEQVGGEIARIAGAVEARFSRAEHIQADALEKLGAEIGRITDRLTERLVSSERRAAQAIDDVGEQVSRVTERIEQRHERASGDLAERIRQSEERTALLLDEARRRIEQRVSESQGAPADAEPRGPFGPELFSRAEPDLEMEVAGVDPEGPRFAAEDFEAADGFTPIPEAPEDLFGLDQPEPPVSESTDGVRPLSTREVIEQARAAARAAQGPRPRTLQAKAKVDRRGASGRFFAGLSLKPRRANSALQTALMVAGGAAFFSVGAAGVVLMEGPAAQREISFPSTFASITALSASR